MPNGYATELKNELKTGSSILEFYLFFQKPRQFIISTYLNSFLNSLAGGFPVLNNRTRVVMYSGPEYNKRKGGRLMWLDCDTDGDDVQSRHIKGHGGKL